MALVRSVHLPPQQPFLEMGSDVSQKASKCTKCQAVIPKKQPRVFIRYKRYYKLHPEKLFFHGVCWQSFIQGESKGTECGDCGNVCYPQTTIKLVMVSGNSYQYKMLCEVCSLSKSYRWCNICASLYPRFYVSKMLDFGGDVNLVQICDKCAHTNGVPTENLERQRDKKNWYIDQQYAKIMQDIVNDDFFGDSNGAW